jgi:hypothetical protein
VRPDLLGGQLFDRVAGAGFSLVGVAFGVVVTLRFSGADSEVLFFVAIG